MTISRKLAAAMVTTLALATVLGPTSGAATGESVDVLYAGSMTQVMERQIVPDVRRQLGIAVAGEGAGSSELAEFIRSGQKPADVFISASPTVIRTDLMGPQNHNLARWFLTFAGDSLVIAYNPQSRFAADLRSAATGQKPWFRVLAEPGLRLGRTDPRLDPKGTSTLILFALAAQQLHLPKLSQTILGTTENPAQVFPEEDLLARLNTGQLDAVIAYHHEAKEWHVPFISLPAQVNLGNPKDASLYAATQVRIGSTSRSGSLIAFALTIPTTARHPAAAAAFVRYLLGATGRRLLAQQGFVPMPVTVGGDRAALPATLKAVIPGEHQSQ